MRIVYFFIFQEVAAREKITKRHPERYSLFEDDRVKEAELNVFTTTQLSNDVLTVKEAELNVFTTIQLPNDVSTSSTKYFKAVDTTVIPEIETGKEDEANRKRRFGMWEADMSIPDTLEGVVNAVADPFDLRDVLNSLPDVLVVPFYVILMVITVIWNIGLFSLAVFVGFKSFRLMFYVCERVGILLCGCFSRKCCFRISNKCFSGLENSLALENV